MIEQRLGGRNGQLSLHLVRFAAVALTAELRRRGAAARGVRVAAKEESGLIVAFNASDLAREHKFAVLVMAAHAGNRRYYAAEGPEPDVKSVIRVGENGRSRPVHVNS